eukprot:7331319-Alexandrium_andersonii.AAC.1
MAIFDSSRTSSVPGRRACLSLRTLLLLLTLTKGLRLRALPRGGRSSSTSPSPVGHSETGGGAEDRGQLGSVAAR